MHDRLSYERSSQEFLAEEHAAAKAAQYISRISPLYPAYISPMSRLYLPYILADEHAAAKAALPTLTPNPNPLTLTPNSNPNPLTLTPNPNPNP